MAAVVLSSVDLDVFGGPAVVDVSVDFGLTGDRGNMIWAGPGLPELYTIADLVMLYDIYIDTNSGVMYQYILQVGSPAWTPISNIVLSQKSFIATTTFTAGSTTISVPISNITQDSGVAASDFVIRFNIEGSNPVSSGFTATIVGTNLSIVINAIEYSGGTWSNLTGSKNVHMLISYTG